MITNPEIAVGGIGGGGGGVGGVIDGPSGDDEDIKENNAIKIESYLMLCLTMYPILIRGFRKFNFPMIHHSF